MSRCYIKVPGNKFEGFTPTLAKTCICATPTSDFTLQWSRLNRCQLNQTSKIFVRSGKKTNNFVWLVNGKLTRVRLGYMFRDAKENAICCKYGKIVQLSLGTTRYSLYSYCCSTDLHGHPRSMIFVSCYRAYAMINSSIGLISYRLATTHQWQTEGHRRQPCHKRLQMLTA